MNAQQTLRGREPVDLALRMPHRLHRPSSLYALAGFLHLIIALFDKVVVGVDIQGNPQMDWNWLWHAIPSDLVRTRFLESLWHLHAQPPLYNLYGALWIRLFPSHYMQALHYSNICLGALLTSMIASTVGRVSRRPRLGFIAGLVVAVHPCMVIFEAFVHYPLFSAFLVVTAVWFLVRASEVRSDSSILAFVLSVNAMVLARSVFHLVFLVPAVVMAVRLAGARWRPVLVGSFLVSLLSLGWFAKNLALFGFFGSSSWMGIGLWQACSSGYSMEEVAALHKKGVVDSVVAELREEKKLTYFRPSRFASYGFAKQSSVPLLARDDFHNINMIDISRMYRTNSLALIRHAPLRYLQNCFVGYLMFCNPSCRDPFTMHNVARIRAREFIAHRIVLGQAVLKPLFERLRYWNVGTVYVLLLPGMLTAYVIRCIRRVKGSGGGLWTPLDEDPVSAFMAVVIVYVTVVSSMFEHKDNSRYKFMIEPTIIAFAVILLSRSWRQRRKSGGGGTGPGGGQPGGSEGREEGDAGETGTGRKGPTRR